MTERQVVKLSAWPMVMSEAADVLTFASNGQREGEMPRFVERRKKTSLLSGCAQYSKGYS